MEYQKEKEFGYSEYHLKIPICVLPFGSVVGESPACLACNPLSVWLMLCHADIACMQPPASTTAVVRLCVIPGYAFALMHFSLSFPPQLFLFSITQQQHITQIRHNKESCQFFSLPSPHLTQGAHNQHHLFPFSAPNTHDRRKRRESRARTSGNNC